MNIEGYRNVVHEDIRLAAQAGGSSEADEFLLYSARLLEDTEYDEYKECHYEGLTRRKGNMRFDGYAIDETDGTLCLFIVDYRGPEGNESIIGEQINAAFKRIRLFVEEASRTMLCDEIYDNPEAKELAARIQYGDNCSKYRFFLMTDAYNRQRVKTIKDDTIAGKTVELNVWDISRLYDLVCSARMKESVEIDITDYGYEGIPCVKAVEYHNVVADIDVVPDSEAISDEKKPENLVSYTSYLAVVPGQLLNDLYLEYGSKLLEGNVRSFLSVRGKVNKKIQATIKNYPEMFFAYNNGIAATATEIETDMTEEGLVITRIKDLQIVNGGQTTASIANTLLMAKKSEHIDISSLYVPMKVSVLEHDEAEKIIPKISEYSNSQNKVDASDFFSNHPFHIRMEDFSRKTATPSAEGRQYQQYWFYERTRGQYNQGKMKFGRNASELKKYADRYPEKQVITMLDFARYMELYECEPQIVSRGKQKTLQLFAERIKEQWEKSNTQFNSYYYKRMVAIAIMYQRTDAMIKETAWYKEKHSYKANVIAYTLSLIFNRIQTRYKEYELDFIRIWDMQDIYEELEEQIAVLIGEVYSFITGNRETENVTEWCKKDSCWKKAKEQSWSFMNPFFNTLISKQDIQNENGQAKEVQKLKNEMGSLKEIMARGTGYWKQLLDWGLSRRLLSEKEISIIKMIINMEFTARIPTERQAKVVMNARQRLIDEGMPYQF